MNISQAYIVDITFPKFRTSDKIPFFHSRESGDPEILQNDLRFKIIQIPIFAGMIESLYSLVPGSPGSRHELKGQI